MKKIIYLIIVILLSLPPKLSFATTYSISDIAKKDGTVVSGFKIYVWDLGATRCGTLPPDGSAPAGSATSAVDGTYTITGLTNHVHLRAIVDPDSGKCTLLDEVTPS